MLPAEPYHVAYLVADLEAEMPRYEAMLGVEFREPMWRQLSEGEGAGMAEPGPPFEVLFTYSIADRQPYVELVQMGSGRIYQPERGAGFHHVGVWAPEPEAVQAALVGRGGEIEARYFSPDGVERVCFASLGGVRFELVNEAIREQTEAWLPNGVKHSV